LLGLGDGVLDGPAAELMKAGHYWKRVTKRRCQGVSTAREA
jgi:hypothetical protein